MTTKPPVPTVVLVHGAFANSSSWNGVIRELGSDNQRVVAAPNPLRGLAADAQYLAAFLASLHGPIVLVGESYGGAVISAAADGNPDVKALVYVAAFAPDLGETVHGLAERFPGSTLGEAVRPVPFPLPDGSTGTDLYVDPDAYHQQIAADVPAATAGLMAATQHPVAAAALQEPATRAAWKTLPCWTLITTQDRNLPSAAQHFMADRAHAVTQEVHASHAVTTSRPDAVAHLISRAVTQTTG